ncbi:hypothetical protein METBIDRAFT_76880 [Metschnikowia bicuspidata var. bicuspidata NRRL YB-4993]|uniref:glucan endo-1,3-beta-D-glucosidase n=1 Tax=Metschnikowia bicuspidata var. bicuspidata NRRL YB-4993 TaxID=869754 RepID=A0A1A0HJE7_9ASCO|nr:hypothetical protein METBIDRAFT_76880 [Metschnikowia bicuspidata var. bicuspidata NRRL YB-4993]OBA23963.1 hypothetical protein METBIDRAFT_76880 [Metschnikowia bicuspidata var. bicuspidata NRRL YB-4993]
MAMFLKCLGATQGISGLQGRSASSSNSAVDTIAFENVGFTGYYYDVQEILNADSEDCSCTLSDSFTVFEGSNAPLDEELSIHFRGPLSLWLFGAYTADDSSSGTWDRVSYYDSNSQASTNITFLTHAGESSTCLGSALTFASGNGTGYADSSTILESNNLINSNEEFIIFSGLACPDSGFDNSCGIYRSGIPAYHGFSGTTKMFLFEFEMPEANVTLEYYYNMPAIWFLNAKIPRTSQYGSDASCSCWNSGCGEIDIFEVMNSSTTGQLYATIHDYQGTGDINTGMQADGYFSRDVSSTMKGGVVFGTDGTISIFMLDSLEISESLDASSVASWISTADEVVDTLSSVTMNTSTTASKSSNGVMSISQSRSAAFMSFVFLLFMYF